MASGGSHDPKTSNQRGDGWGGALAKAQGHVQPVSMDGWELRQHFQESGRRTWFRPE
jgi:hypothetical protein